MKLEKRCYLIKKVKLNNIANEQAENYFGGRALQHILNIPAYSESYS